MRARYTCPPSCIFETRVKTNNVSVPVLRGGKQSSLAAMYTYAWVELGTIPS